MSLANPIVAHSNMRGQRMEAENFFRQKTAPRMVKLRAKSGELDVMYDQKSLFAGSKSL